jgi:cyclopropane-fatty-acyl-phospholipid synthase
MLSIFKKLTGIQPEAVYEPVVESGYLPDIALRAGIRALLARRKASLQYKTVQEQDEAMVNYIHKLKETKEIAIKTKEANEQHYEVPSEFFVNCLGKRLKYSSCLFETGAKNLDEAEEAMLDLYCQRAQIEDGMHVLDLGCGWGSLCLYLAKVSLF